MARYAPGFRSFGFEVAAWIMHGLVFKKAVGGTAGSRVTFSTPFQAGNALLGTCRGRNHKEAQ